MNPAKAAARLNGKRQTFQPGIGGESITEHDIAHAMGSLWSDGAALLGRVKWAGQEEYMTKLVKFLVLEVTTLSNQQKWLCTKDEIEKVCRLAIHESISPKLCRSCNGLGELWVKKSPGRPKANSPPDLRIVCQACEGSGTKQLSVSRLAETAGMNWQKFNRHWLQRYGQITGIVSKYERLFWSGINRKLG